MSDAEKKNILLAEDDAFVSDIYYTKLTNEGYNVILAPDGRVAIDEIKKSIPDLILLDIMMPYMDGMEVLDELKNNDEWKNIPVLLLTNLSEKENVKKALELGAQDYLIKSHFTPSEILEKIQALLGE
jgi:DNA-binding response OmpR family regulator